MPEHDSVSRHHASPVTTASVAAVFQRWLVTASIIALPLVFIPIPGIAARINVNATLVMLAATMACFSGHLRADFRRMGPALWIFLIANLLYLNWLGAMSWLRDDDVSPWFFCGRAVVLVGVLTIAFHLVRRFERGTLGSYLVRCTVGATLATAVAWLIGCQMADISPKEHLATFIGLASNPVMLENQLAFEAFQTFRSVGTDEIDAPGYKNTVAEALAILVTASLVLSRSIRPLGKLGLTLASAVVVLSLSRSALLILVVALFWLMLSAKRDTLLLCFLAAAVLIPPAVLWIVHSGEGNLFVDRMQPNRATELRMDQLAYAFRQELTVSEFLMGTGADYQVDGYRIHNLLFSSWVEGGLIGLLLVVTQYASALTVALRRVRWQRFAFVTVALLWVGVGRTMVAGGGGYYTLAGMLAMCLFFLIAKWPIETPATDA